MKCGVKRQVPRNSRKKKKKKHKKPSPQQKHSWTKWNGKRFIFVVFLYNSFYCLLYFFLCHSVPRYICFRADFELWVRRLLFTGLLSIWSETVSVCADTVIRVNRFVFFFEHDDCQSDYSAQHTHTHTPHFCSSFRWLWLHNFIASRPLWLQLLLLFISYFFFIVFARLTLCLHSFNVMWLFSHRVQCQSQSATCFARRNIIVLYVKWCNFMLNDNFVMWAELDMARLVVHLMSNYYQCKVLGYLFHSSSSIGMYANECLVVIVAFIAARGEKWFLRKLFNRETI